MILPLLKADADLGVKGKHGCDGLHLAARYGQDAVLKELLDLAPHSLTPLCLAAMYNRSSAVSLLLPAGASQSAGTLDDHHPPTLVCQDRPMAIAAVRVHNEIVLILDRRGVATGGVNAVFTFC